jgi:diguanylate cyclase (GGDEF)-like protein
MKASRSLGTHFKQGETIFRQGDSADCMFVVQKGKVEIVMETEFGSNRLVIKKKGDVFGEISLFACRARFATARALKDCIILKVDERAFIAKLHQDPSLAFRTIQGMARRIYEQDHTLMRGFFHQEEQCCEITGFTSYIDLAVFLDAEVNRARRLMQIMAFAIVEIDGYSDLCANFGIETGELVLKSLASIIKNHLRHSDVVGKFGDDRFGVLLYEADGVVASKVMENVRLAFLAHVSEMGVEGLEARFSCGIAIYPEHDKAVKLNKAAFKALTQGKADGENRVTLANPGADWQNNAFKKRKSDPSVIKKQPGWGFGFFTAK